MTSAEHLQARQPTSRLAQQPARCPSDRVSSEQNFTMSRSVPEDCRRIILIIMIITINIIITMKLLLKIMKD